MKQLFFELVNWIAPRELPIPQRAPQSPQPPQPAPSPQPALRADPRIQSPPAPGRSVELPSESSLEGLSRKLLNQLGCRELANRVCVQWNSRLQTTAGRAHYNESKVVLNPRLIKFGNEEIDRTLRHELAHLLAKHRAGRHKIDPHGSEWKQACCDLGLLDEKRTHTLPLPRRVVNRKYAYACPNCGTAIARVRPFRSKVACLSCCRKFGKGGYDERFRLVKK